MKNISSVVPLSVKPGVHRKFQFIYALEEVLDPSHRFFIFELWKRISFGIIVVLTYCGFISFTVTSCIQASMYFGNRHHFLSFWDNRISDCSKLPGSLLSGDPRVFTACQFDLLAPSSPPDHIIFNIATTGIYKLEYSTGEVFYDIPSGSSWGPILLTSEVLPLLSTAEALTDTSSATVDEDYSVTKSNYNPYNLSVSYLTRNSWPSFFPGSSFAVDRSASTSYEFRNNALYQIQSNGVRKRIFKVVKLEALYKNPISIMGSFHAISSDVVGSTATIGYVPFFWRTKFPSSNRSNEYKVFGIIGSSEMNVSMAEEFLKNYPNLLKAGNDFVILGLFSCFCGILFLSIPSVSIFLLCASITEFATGGSWYVGDAVWKLVFAVILVGIYTGFQLYKEHYTAGHTFETIKRGWYYICIYFHRSWKLPESTNKYSAINANIDDEALNDIDTSNQLICAQLKSSGWKDFQTDGLLELTQARMLKGIEINAQEKLRQENGVLETGVRFNHRESELYSIGMNLFEHETVSTQITPNHGSSITGPVSGGVKSNETLNDLSNPHYADASYLLDEEMSSNNKVLH